MSDGITSASSGGPVYVSTSHLVLAAVPLFGLAIVSNQMGLGLESPMVVGTVRTAVQLFILGTILHPIFLLGETFPWLVAGYVLFMTVLASREATARSKYYFSEMFYTILLSVVVNISIVSFLAFGIIIRPTPIWNPQYVIPIVGMLLGNGITGIGLALNSITSSLVEQATMVELYLAFGAKPRQACAQQLREAVRVGTMPMLNTMSVIGLISIPGMMTGQILGGSPVMEAARYQMLICYLIAVSSFGTVLLECAMVIALSFDIKWETLRSDMFKTRNVKSNFLGQLAGFMHGVVALRRFLLGPGPEGTQPLIETRLSLAANNKTNGYGSESSTTTPNAAMELVTVRPGEVSSSYSCASSTTASPLLEIRQAKHTIHATETILFQNLSYTLWPGSVVIVRGPSGIGKSQLLRLVAGLTPLPSDTDLLLDGCPLLRCNHNNNSTITKYCLSPNQWRQQVRYVGQHRIEIPGTPRDFLQRVSSFQSVRQQLQHPDSITLEELTSTTLKLIRDYGLDATNLDKQWGALSGGESQRIHAAIAIASRPRVILMDESTSALDLASKCKVEQSVLRLASEAGVGVLWISHDADQIDRLRFA